MEKTHSPLALWHLLSLDAPTVATLWTWFIGHCAGIRLSAASLAAMFSAVWLLYAADRLLDARVSGHAAQTGALPELELRHHFHHRHLRAFLTGIVIAGVLLAALLPFLPAAALRLYTILGALLVSWFLLIHTRLAASTRLPKELAVGIFFPAAVFIPTVAVLPELRLVLLGPALLFASLCTLNCVFLYAWEHHAGSPEPPASTAHWTTRFALARLRETAWATLLGSFGLYAFFIGLAKAHSLIRFGPASMGQAIDLTPLAPLVAACLFSTALLLLIDRYRHRLSAVHLRAVADLALLTPALWLVCGRSI